MEHEPHCEVVEVVFSPASEIVTWCVCRITKETTVYEAIQGSGILQHHAEIDLNLMRVGIYGKLKKLDALVKAGDRIEIYRPLIADPKKTRRLRAQKPR